MEINDLPTSTFGGRLCIFNDYFILCCRLRDERGDMDRVMAMDKAREGSHNGK